MCSLTVRFQFPQLLLSTRLQRIICLPSASLQQSSSAARVLPAATHKLTSSQVFDREKQYSAHNYKPIPVALVRGKGT